MSSSETQTRSASTPHQSAISTIPRAQSDSTVSTTFRAQGDSLLDPLYISDSEDEHSPGVTYISSDSEDESGHPSQDTITDEFGRDETHLRKEMHKYHLCPICLETAFQPYVLACGHTFCVHCLNRLRKIGREKQSSFLCPTCRAKVTHKPILCFNLQGAAEAVMAHQKVFRPAPKKLRW